MRSALRRCLLAVPLAAAACAHATPAPAPEPVVVTGSHLPQRVDLSTGLPATTSPVTVWTPQDLQRTGKAPDDVAGALRDLDPSVKVH
jgi:hypothetical protein